jgi:hypothetical protein
VLAEKNATQFFLIAASADDELPPEEPPEAGVELAEDAGVVVELALGAELPPQPASARPIAAAIAGSATIRCVMKWIRMVSASLLTVILLVSEKGARR